MGLQQSAVHPAVMRVDDMMIWKTTFNNILYLAAACFNLGIKISRWIAVNARFPTL